MELTAAHPHSDSHSLSSLHFICALLSSPPVEILFFSACRWWVGGWKIDRKFICVAHEAHLHADDDTKSTLCCAPAL